jgi:hypothetical protein
MKVAGVSDLLDRCDGHNAPPRHVKSASIINVTKHRDAIAAGPEIKPPLEGAWQSLRALTRLLQRPMAAE